MSNEKPARSHLSRSLLAVTVSFLLCGCAPRISSESQAQGTSEPTPSTEMTQPDVRVSATDAGWIVRKGDEVLHQSADMAAAIQSAVDSLTPDRTQQETVHVHASGVFHPPEGSGRAVGVTLPSHTLLDFQGHTVHVAPGEDFIAFRLHEVREVDIRNLTLTGTPAFAIFIKACEDIRFANLHLSLLPHDEEGEWGGAGIRSEGGDRPWSGEHNRNIVMENVSVEHTRGHGIELWRTDGFTADTITTRHTGGCGILLNQTQNVRIGLVDAFRANPGGGYSGFRVANRGGPNIEVDKVVAVDCGRGIFTVSGSGGITIHEVDIRDSTGMGMFIEDTQNVSINGGTISNSGGDGVRIHSRRPGQGPGDDHPPSAHVTVQNLRVYGSPFGMKESGERTDNNRILDNDLRGNETCLEYRGENTVAEGNVCE